MRDHGSIAPAFWTGATGKKLRKNKDARILMTHFMTGPSAHALGLYYVSIPAILHETGLTEAEFDAALRFLAVDCDGAAFYDADREWVWVPRMAHYQLGEAIKANDKRMPWVRRHLDHFRGHSFYVQFLLAYGIAYCLSDLMEAVDRKPTGPSVSLLRTGKTLPDDGESLRTRQDQDQDQGKDQEQGRESPPARDPMATAPEPGPEQPPRPLAIAKPTAPSAHELKRRWGILRSEISEGVFLPWEGPGDPRGETASWVASLSPEAIADLEPAMRLALCNMRDRVRDWDDPKMWEDVNFGFGSFRARFSALRETLHGRRAPQRPGGAARASPTLARSEKATDAYLDEQATCSFHREVPDKPSSESVPWCRVCKRLGARRPRQTGTTEPEPIAGAK